MKKLLLLLILTITGFGIQAQCTYTITGADSWGDGWNGGSVDIDVAGTVTNFTVSGFSATLSIPSFAGDAVTFTWNAGSYDSEVTFSILAPDGTSLGSYGTYPTVGLFLSDISNSNCAPPSCLSPTALTPSNIALTSATINWTASASAPSGGYEWEVRTSGAGGSGATGLTTSGSVAAGVLTANATGLSANTTYQYYVRSNCGAAVFSTWATSSFFTGYCQVSVGSTGDYISTFSTTGGFTNIANSATGSTAYQDFTAQSVSAAAGSTVNFSGAYVGGSAGFAIWVDWNNDLVFDLAERVYSAPSATASWTGSFAVPGAQAVGSYRMRIRGAWNTTVIPACGSTTYGQTEDYTFTVSLPPACMAPTALTAAAITAAGANLAWTEGGTATTWNVEYGVSGFTQGAGTVVTGTATNPYAVSGLTANTAYAFYVQSICGSSLSTWTGPFAFTTPCATFTAPYLENYDAALATPACWTNVTGGEPWSFQVSGGAGPGYGVAGSVDHTTGSGNFAWIDASGGIGANQLISPVIDFSGLTIPEVGYWIKSNNTNDAAQNTLQLSAWDGAAWVVLDTYGANNAAWVKVSAIVPAGIPTTTQFRLVQIVSPTGSAFYNDLLVDDFYVQEGPVPCSAAAPGATTSTSTLACNGISFQLGFTNHPIETGYTYQWQSSPDNVTYTSVTGTDSTLVTSITSDTWFQCEVTCTNGGATAVSTPILVNLNAPSNCYCIPIYGTTASSGCMDGDVIARVILNTLDNNSGTGCPSGIAGYSDYTGDPSLTTTLSAGTTYGCTVYAGQYSEGYKAWVDYNQDGIFDNVTEVIGNTTSAVPGSGLVGVLGSSVTFPITLACNPTPGVYRLRIRCIYANAGPSIDPCALQSPWGETEDYLITIAPPPPCPVISALAVGTVGTTTANFTWSQGCAETQWRIAVNTSATPPASGGTLISVTNYSAAGLLPNTTYYAHVRAICGVPVSSWTTISFTTLAAVPANDLCAGAITLTCGQTATVTTTAATTDASQGACGIGSGGTPSLGVWYTFIGTGDDIQLSLCNSNFDTKLHIYSSTSGNCSTLTCLDSNDDGSLCASFSLQSSITFTSVLGTTYYFLPGGYGTSTGDLEISISCIPVGVVTWLGTSIDAALPANWSSGVVPGCGTDIFIPLTSNNPTFNGLFECQNFGMASSVSPTITLTSTLGVCGDVTMSNGSSIVGPGVMSLNGTNGGVNFVGAATPSVSNLRLNSNYTFTGNVNITNSLVLNGGNVDATGGLITLKSTATSTAYFDDFTTPGNTYTGSLKQERYVTTGVLGGVAIGQRLFGSAVAGSPVTGLNGTYAGYSTGTGQVIPLATCDPNNLAQNSPYSNLFSWNEDATFLFGCYQSGWTALNAASTNLTPSRGYSGWMSAGTTLSVTGLPNTGAASYGTLGNTNGVAQAAGWHVLSNPYSSPMDVDAVTADGFTSPQYYNNNTAYSGTYQPVIASGGIVPVMQGFVAFTAGPNTFNPSNADRIASNNPNFAKSANWFDYKLEVEVDNHGNADITYLYYSDNTSTEFDAAGDCVKRHSDASKPTLFTKMNGEELSLNGLHLDDLGKSIPMGLITPQIGAYTFNFAGMSSFPANTTIYVEDLVTGALHNVEEGAYTFTADPSQNGTDRFMVHFVLPASFNLIEATCEGAQAMIVENTLDGRDLIISENGVQVIAGKLDGSSNAVNSGTYKVEVYDQFGGIQVYDISVDAIALVDATIVASQTTIEVGESINFNYAGNGATNFEWSVNGQLVASSQMLNFAFNQAGMFEVAIDVASDDCAARASQIVTVNEKTTAITGVGNGSIAIFGSEGNVVLNFVNINQGNANVAIYNLLGQELTSVRVDSNGKQTIQNSNWADGYYMVKVKIGSEVVNATVMLIK